MIQLSARLLWVHLIPQLSLWLLHSRVRSMIQVLISRLLLKFVISSLRSEKSILKAVFLILRCSVLMQIHSFIRCPAVCFQTLFLSLNRPARLISLKRCSVRFREFVRIQVIRRLLLQHHRLSVHRLCLISLWAKDIKW